MANLIEKIKKRFRYTRRKRRANYRDPNIQKMMRKREHESYVWWYTHIFAYQKLFVIHLLLYIFYYFIIVGVNKEHGVYDMVSHKGTWYGLFLSIFEFSYYERSHRTFYYEPLNRFLDPYNRVYILNPLWYFIASFLFCIFLYNEKYKRRLENEWQWHTVRYMEMLNILDKFQDLTTKEQRDLFYDTYKGYFTHLGYTLELDMAIQLQEDELSYFLIKKQDELLENIKTLENLENMYGSKILYLEDLKYSFLDEMVFPRTAHAKQKRKEWIDKYFLEVCIPNIKDHVKMEFYFDFKFYKDAYDLYLKRYYGAHNFYLVETIELIEQELENRGVKVDSKPLDSKKK